VIDSERSILNSGVQSTGIEVTRCQPALWTAKSCSPATHTHNPPAFKPISTDRAPETQNTPTGLQIWNAMHTSAAIAHAPAKTR
jgi:hypothetical protein